MKEHATTIFKESNKHFKKKTSFALVFDGKASWIPIVSFLRTYSLLNVPFQLRLVLRHFKKGNEALRVLEELKKNIKDEKSLI